MDRLYTSVKDQVFHIYPSLSLSHPCTRIVTQMDEFISAFREIIPFEVTCLFHAHELEMLMCGVQEINLDDWKANTVLRGLEESAKPVKWFWNIMKKWSNEKRAGILQVF